MVDDSMITYQTEMRMTSLVVNNLGILIHFFLKQGFAIFLIDLLEEHRSC